MFTVTFLSAVLLPHAAAFVLLLPS